MQYFDLNLKLMKKCLLSLLFGLFFMISPSTAQEFSFQMYFTDAQGNKDTLTIGYDPAGSRDTIIPDFGEENIANIPFDSIFDVRITNQADINGASFSYDYELYHTKKKIVLLDCEEDYLWFDIMPFVNIDIRAKHWPVKIEWDDHMFESECHAGSLFASWHPAFWWDWGISYSDFERIVLNNNNELEFAANYPESWEDHTPDDYHNYYADDDGNPIATFWLAFGDPSLLTLNTPEISPDDETIVYPNPTTGPVKIINNNQSAKQIIIYDTTGKQFFAEKNSNEIDLGHLPDGLYLIKITWVGGTTEIHSVLKNDYF